MDFQSKFEQALCYADFLQEHATDEQRRRFAAVHEAVQLGSDQLQLLGSMSRRIYGLCMAGAWCGDCVEQCPVIQRLFDAAPALELRFMDRDADPELAGELQLCGSPRVPQVVFLNEDFDVIGRFGDRTLVKYRRMAETQLGAACPTGLGVDVELTNAVAQGWLDELERLHWMVRLSPKLRERHND